MRFQFSGPPRKRRLSWACILCLPLLSSSGSQELDAWVQCASSPPRSQPQFHTCPGQSWFLAATLLADVNHQNLRRSLVRNWKPVCSLVGDAISGAEFAPFPSPLPPASSWGWASPQPSSSSLEFLSPSFVLRTGWQCVRLALFAG